MMTRKTDKLIPCNKNFKKKYKKIKELLGNI